MADHYKISFSTARTDDDGALREAHIEATLTPDRGRIKLIRAASDSGLYHGWAGFLTKIEAEDASGRAVALRYEKPGVWRVVGRSRGEITLRYSMNLQHDRFLNEPGDDELAYARPYGVMWTTRAMLMEGAPSSDIIVEFDLPDGWKVSTPWRRRSAGEAVFLPNDTDDLLDAAFMAGEHIEKSFDMGAAQALLALGPPVEGLSALFEPLMQGFFGAYTELFDDSPDNNFLLIAGDASFLGGGVMGRTISLSLNEEAAGPQGQLLAAYIIAHEGFHLWNAQWGSQNKNAGELEWLAEGLAEYYAFLTSVRLGLLDEEIFLGLVSERYGAYLMALASGDSLVSAAATKNTSSTSSDLIYNGGMMAALLFDLEIRRSTNGDKSLDDVVRSIHAQCANSKTELTLTDLRRLIRQDTGVDFGVAMRKNIRRTEPFDLTAALAGAGLSADITHTDDSASIEITRAATPSLAQETLYRAWLSGD
ncbi:MAG: hypothetical protein JKX88_08230 [Marinicaulis sp.]|nr:hypothetical protein [Marinicaulis sp.]